MLGDEKSDFIVFMDEDGNKKEMFVDITELKDSFVTFKTSSNLITIPIHRVLKIKRKDVTNDQQ